MTYKQYSLSLYGTSACHLCEQAEVLISPILPKAGIPLNKIDISDYPDLLERYGAHIPVLVMIDNQPDALNKQRELFWPFTADQAETLICGK